jgi:hypothetical protein
MKSTLPAFRCLLALTAAYVTAPARADGAESLRIALNLHGAVFYGEAPAADGPVLAFELRREGGRWHRAWAVVSDIWKAPAYAYVTQATLTNGLFELSLAARTQRDSWVPGGTGRYTVRMQRAASGGYSGRFEGTYRDVPVEGLAEATLEPAVPRLRPPAGPDEHPRLLFRKDDLPALRAKAQTPFGREAWRILGGDEPGGDPVSLGLRYQLGGDPRFALAAMEPVARLMSQGLVSDQYGNNAGDRCMRVAFAYDLCHDAWDVDFREKVLDYFRYVIRSIQHSQAMFNTSINWNVASNWSAPLYNGAALGGLMLWNRPGPAPSRPPEPEPAVLAPPAADETFGEGVPVADLVSGEMPAEWIYAGGFIADELKAGDPLAALGGPTLARPHVGLALSTGGCVDTFRPLSREKDKGFYQSEKLGSGKPMIDITNAIGRRYHSTSYFHTVLRNAEPGWYRFQTGYDAATGYVNGVARRDGECVWLDAGAYPLLIVAPIAQTNPWGRDLMQPRLTRIDTPEVEAYVRQRARAHADDLRFWRHELAEWEANGGLDPVGQRAFEATRRLMSFAYRDAIGDGGFQAEVSHYSQIASGEMLPYAAAYRVMFGEDLSPYPDIRLHVVQKLFNHVFLPDGRFIAQEINGKPELWAKQLAAAFPLAPETYRPALLWHWRALAGGKDGTTDAEILAHDTVRAFVNYPLDLEPRPPAGILPLSWLAPTYGYAGFRSGWDGQGDTLLQVFARSHPIGGWNGPNAGTFRLSGLGHVWASGPSDRHRMRTEENVLWLPDNPDINLGACGVILHHHAEADGSGSIRIGLDDVYATFDPENKRLYSRMGNFRRASAFRDSGIRGTRALAADYSGKSGAPALIAIADRLRGGKTKSFLWQLEKPKAKEDSGDLSRTTIEGRRFIIDKGDARLVGTFVSPANLTLVAESRTHTMIGGAGSSKGKELPRPTHGVFADTTDTYADFLCIVTLLPAGVPIPEPVGIREGVYQIGGQILHSDSKGLRFGD